MDKQIEAIHIQGVFYEVPTKTSEIQLHDTYQFVMSDIGMQVILSLDHDEKAFELNVDFGGSTYNVEGMYSVKQNVEILLKSNDNVPKFIWAG